MAVIPESEQSPHVRDRIEQAARSIFAEQEFHKVGLADIAAGAHASLQTLYRYYGSKEAILNACLQHALEELAERMLDHLAGIETCKDRLSKVFWVVLDYFDRNPQAGRMMINSVYPGLWSADSSALQHRLTGLFLNVLGDGQQSGVLNDQVDTLTLLDYFYGVLVRLIQMHLLRQRPGPLAQQHAVMFEMLWRGISKPPL